MSTKSVDVSTKELGVITMQKQLDILNYTKQLFLGIIKFEIDKFFLNKLNNFKV